MQLESNSLIVTFHADTCQLIIKDKRNGKFWKQSPFPEKMNLSDVQIMPKEQKMHFTFSGKLPLTLTVSLEETEILYTLSSDSELPMEDLEFPPAFQAPDKNHYILQTDSEGLLLPVNDCGYPLEQQPLFRCSGIF